MCWICKPQPSWNDKLSGRYYIAIPNLQELVMKHIISQITDYQECD